MSTDERSVDADMKSALILVQKLYNWFAKAMSNLQSPFLLVVRLYWGWQISQNGWAKLHNIPRVTEFFASLGLPAPAPTAIFVSSTELIVGILLALGLLSRIGALALTIDMTVAYITADRAALLSFFSDPGKFYTADPYTFLFAALLILIFGPGKLSVDTFLERLVAKPRVGEARMSAI
jgi:putative oxidoreductase